MHLADYTICAARYSKRSQCGGCIYRYKRRPLLLSRNELTVYTCDVLFLLSSFFLPFSRVGALSFGDGVCQLGGLFFSSLGIC